jgi:phosphonate degradation associated HDIG domain protein
MRRRRSITVTAWQTEAVQTPSDVVSLWSARGNIAYQGEGVSQLEHAWQSGRLALQARASPQLHLAAWLHDVGHLMTTLEGSPTVQGIDDLHEEIGATALNSLFGPAVARPVALHVAAKRCLVSTQAGYAASLSPDSVRSLALQGGPMTNEECAAFMRQAHARDALRLRVWDDVAKRHDLKPPDTTSMLAELSAVMAAVVAAR